MADCLCGGGPGSDPTLNRLQGYQVFPSGVGIQAQIADSSSYQQNFRATSYLSNGTEPGFNGFRPLMTTDAVVARFLQPGYFGKFPTSEQPKIERPQPWQL